MTGYCKLKMRRGEKVNLSRLWTDKPVKLKGDPQTNNKQRGEKRRERGEKRRGATNQRGKKKKDQREGVGNYAPVTSLDRHTVTNKQRSVRDLNRVGGETEHLPRLWTDTLCK